MSDNSSPKVIVFDSEAMSLMLICSLSISFSSGLLAAAAPRFDFSRGLTVFTMVFFGFMFIQIMVIGVVRRIVVAIQENGKVENNPL
jgi:hypothetical protein